MTITKLDQFTTAYIECALWSSMGDWCEDCGELPKDSSETCACGGKFISIPLDDEHDMSDIAPETLDRIIADCADFQEANAKLLSAWYSECGESMERAGHDFWLTRNRHGAGYWDRWNEGTPQGKIGRKLTAAAHAYGTCDLYVGDDGRIYAS